jgi:hypothetical protein
MKEYTFDWQVGISTGTIDKPSPIKIVRGQQVIKATNKNEAEKTLVDVLSKKYKTDLVQFKFAADKDDYYRSLGFKKDTWGKRKMKNYNGQNAAKKMARMTKKNLKNFVTKLDASKLNRVLLELGYDEEYAGRFFTNGSIIMDMLKQAKIQHSEYKIYVEEFIKAGILEMKSFEEIKDEYQEINVHTPNDVLKRTKTGNARYGHWLNGLRSAVTDDEYDGPGHYVPVSEGWIHGYSLKNDYNKAESEGFFEKALTDGFLRRIVSKEGDLEGYVVEDDKAFYAIYYVDFFKNAK